MRKQAIFSARLNKLMPDDLSFNDMLSYAKNAVYGEVS